MSGKNRPENSLLEIDAEWDTTRRAAPEVRPDCSREPLLNCRKGYRRHVPHCTQAAIERTTSLENIIKQRILDERWDSVIPQRRASPPQKAEDGAPELSQEKSGVGLGELYEKVRPSSTPFRCIHGLSGGCSHLSRPFVVLRSISIPPWELNERTNTARREKRHSVSSKWCVVRSMPCPISASHHGLSCLI